MCVITRSRYWGSAKSYKSNNQLIDIRIRYALYRSIQTLNIVMFNKLGSHVMHEFDVKM